MSRRDWKQYNAKLVQRGSIRYLFSDEVLQLTKQVPPKGTRGRPRYPDCLIALLLLIKVSYGLTYRATQGFVSCFLVASGIPEVHHTTLCRRMPLLAHLLPKLSKGKGSKTVLVDSSGLKITGEGEWKVKVHGAVRHRQWIKVHLLVDAASQEILEVLLTSANIADVRAAQQFIGRLPRSVCQLLGDGAYDSKSFRRRLRERSIEGVIPTRQGSQLSENLGDEDRNDTVRLIAGLGGDLTAKRLWSKLKGYGVRALVETAFSSLKRTFGDSVFSRRFDSQQVEVWLKAWLLNTWKYSSIAA